ncbi:hypothetical protein G5C51_15510 [Streptomyces sp. A7024]|uniref:Xylulokinase n=1 Tax=Streptomyces coryli TaxID=1128680 RepID=A0A6G4U240_9ACTN|nr:hypothetical protein [Streptomyces coryli]
MALTIGVDIGTSAAKALVLDPGTGVVGRGSAAHPTHTPGPGRAEQDPRAWWTATVAAIRQAAAGVRPEDVSAIAVSGQGAALVLLDDSGEPLRPALIHLDQRAAAEAAELSGASAGAAVMAASGNRVGAWNLAAKLTWVRRHEPGLLARTATVTSAAGYVLSRLAGRQAQNVSDAGISDLFDLGTRGWSGQILAELGLSEKLLPPLYAPTETIGELSPAAARELGLPPAVRIVAGGEDTSAAALAVGVLHPGDAYLSLGTAGVVGVAVGPDARHEPRLLTFPHVRDGLDLLSGSMTSAGAAIAWLAEVTGTDAAGLLAAAESAPPGADGVVFLPYLAGELHPIDDPAARGAFSGLSLVTGQAQLARAVVEGSAGAIAHNLSVARSAGAAPARLAATGRPTASGAWMQAVADATGVPVEVHTGDGAPLGDALLAAAGTDSALPELVRAHSRVEATYQPDPAGQSAAAARQRVASALYEATRSGV